MFGSASGVKPNHSLQRSRSLESTATDSSRTSFYLQASPETLHFGFNSPDSSVPGAEYSKDSKGRKEPIVWKDWEKRGVDIGKLADELGHKASTPKAPIIRLISL